MKNKFLSKAVPRGTRTIWRYLSALILLFSLGIGQMWGADAVAKISFKNAGMATTYSATKISANPSTVGDVNVSWTNIGGFDKQYVSSTSTKDSCVKIDQTASADYTTKYLQFSSTKVITKVELYAAIPGSTSASNEAIVGWSGEPSDTPDTVVVVSIPGKGTSNLTTINFPSAKGIKYVRCYRQVKIKEGKFDSKGTTYGSTTTWCVAYAQITTTEGTSGGYSITYNCDDADYCPSTASGQTSLPSTLPTPKKVGYDFDGWYTTSAKTATVAAGGALSKDTTLYAKWTKVYVPQGANYSFAGQGTMGTAPKAITVTTDNKKNSIANYSRVDNIFFSAMDVYCESGTTGGDDAATGFKGWKIKTSGATIKFYVENDSRVSITMGTLSSGCNITYTAKGASSATTTALTGGAPYYTDNYNVAAGSLVTLTTQGGNTVTLKGIAVSEIPAVSNDATLSDLKVNGTTVAGFASATQIYRTSVAYGTAVADMPKITGATATDANATVSDVQETFYDSDHGYYVSQVKVTAQNGTDYKFYQLRITVEPKLGVELIKALTSTDLTDGVGTATGYIGGKYYTNNGKGATKKLDSNKNYGLELKGDNTFDEGDLFVMNITTAAGATMGTMKLYESAEATDNLYESTNIGTTGLNGWALTDAVDAKNSLFIKRGSGNDWNPTFSSIAVYRLMPAFIDSFSIEGVEDFVIDQDLKTITASVANTFDVTSLTPTIKYWGNGGGAIDKTGAQNFTNPVTYTVSSSYAEDATGAYAPVTYTVTITKIVPAETPNITTDPASANYIEGATIAALSVEASVTDGGTLSYQWQEQEGANWNNITNATNDSYTPTVSAIGTYKYRVIVTNTLTGHPAARDTSAVATIVIAEDPACKAIGYGSTRALATNTEVVIDATTGFKHISSVESCETGKKISGETNLTTVKLGGSSAYYDIYTTEMNIGSIALSLTSSSNGEDKRYKYAVIFCKSAEFDASKILGVVEQVGGAGDDAQVINTPEVPLGTKLVRIMRQYTYKETTYGQGNSSYIYYIRACLVEPAQEVSATVLAQPKDTAYCPTEVVEPLSYELSIEDGASAAYQWYKGTEAIENEEAATYTPSETGVYTCKVTLTKTGRLPKEMTSDEANVTFYIATAITAHVDAVGLVDAEKTISVTAEGTSLTYKWQACDVNGTVTDATVLGTAASLNITIASETKYYLATVTGTCGTETQVVEARMWAHHDPAHVTATTTWDWTNAAWNGVTANIEFANTSDEELMSNVSADVPCLDGVNGFRSDMLYGTGQYVYRPNNKFFQGFKVRFIADVPGIVKVTYRGTGDSKYIILHINDSTYAQYKGGFKTVEALVPAGQVLIEGVGGTDNAGGMTRIQKIEFIADLSGYALADADKTRAVTEGRFGTICMPKGGKVVNGAIFEIAYMDYKDSKPYKIYFDEVVNGLMEPGMPYIFLPNEGAETLGIVSTANKVDDAGHFHGLYGSFTQELLAQNAGNYILQNNQYYYVNSADVYVGANRAYIKLAEVPSYDPGQPAYGRRRVSMNVNAEQVVTDIDNLNAGEQPVKMMIDGKLYILRGEKMFDATGRLVK